jgi:hypothetical protein
LSSLQNVKEAAEKSFDSTEKLFHQSFFCVKQSKLPELKTALNKEIAKFVNDNLDSDGDKIVSVLLGLI